MVVFRGRRHWVAQCLEFGLAAQADSLGELAERLVKTFVAQADLDRERGVPLFSTLPRADERYWNMWPGLERGRREREDSPPSVESRWSLSLSPVGMRAAVAFAG